MANITENTSEWGDIYKIEIADKVLGGDGLGDIANKQAHDLMKRTNYLKFELEKQSVDLFVGLMNGKIADGDLIVLSGVETSISTTTSTDDTIEWTEGSVFYKSEGSVGRVYHVNSGEVIKEEDEVFVFIINEENPNTVSISGGDSGDGIADFGDEIYINNRLKNVFLEILPGEVVNLTSVSCAANLIRKNNIITGTLEVKGIAVANGGYSMGARFPDGFKCQPTQEFVGVKNTMVGTIIRYVNNVLRDIFVIRNGVDVLDALMKVDSGDFSLYAGIDAGVLADDAVRHIVSFTAVAKDSVFD